MTRSRSLALSVCLAAALVLSAPAYAQLTPAQMQAARTFITTEKFVVPELKTQCLDVTLPTGIVRTQDALEALSDQIEEKTKCVGEIRTMTYEPNLRSMLETAYPEASGSQTSELTALAVDTMAPIRKKVMDDLQRTKSSAYALAGPFMARLEIEKAFDKEAERCDEPPPRTFASVVAAQIFLEGYRLFEVCLNQLSQKARSIKPSAFVAQHFASSDNAVRTYLLQELPSIQDAIVKQHTHRLALSRTPRAIAQAYYDAHKNDGADEGWDDDEK